jgi:multidrug efflux pump subunit AcrB
MTADEALREAQKWLDYLEAQKARATKMQELAHLAKTDQKEAQRQMRQMDQQPTVYDGARLADGVRVMVAEIERLRERLLEAQAESALQENYSCEHNGCAMQRNGEYQKEARMYVDNYHAQKAEIERLREALEDACLTFSQHGEQPPQKWLTALAKEEDKP